MSKLSGEAAHDFIDPEQYTICQQRGHKTPYGDGWHKCEWCGIWLREVQTMEERWDAPPEKEMDIVSKLQTYHRRFKSKDSR